MNNQSISWGELSQLTHATQVAEFGWCACEDMFDSTIMPYADCPHVCCVDHIYESYCDCCTGQCNGNLVCENCTYEVSETNIYTGFCQNCQKAYNIGRDHALYGRT